MLIPALVGGITLRADLPGAIAFATAFALLGTVFLWRLVDKRWRTLILIQPLLFAVERQVVFTLRAGMAAKPNTESSGLSKFMQVSFTLGYLNTADTVLKLIRTILVNTTNASGSAATTDHPLSAPSAPSSAPNVDEPRRRFWYRRWSDFLQTLYFTALVAGILATAHQSEASESGPNLAHQIERYASSAIGLVFILLEILTLLWASKTLPRIDQRAVRFLLALTVLLTIPPTYRLVVMRHTTPDVHALGHQALNTGADKAAFYIVHMVPEWAVLLLMSVVNVRDICQTGLKGDTRWWDETPKERAKRERKEREKTRKKAEAKNTSTIELGLIER
ncbi:hypothetical protein DFH08DRAFT_468177 [Mycena albidolilacea]|uniref:Uncharacterized protein n=1 Tax=Mycena albidolilacea TaxID=1033008 RepID=A0AAD7EYG8_9AGAR|nr:hypothetical protein DFH08DRAFT_468177 [Mycena albidolilacea]